MHSTFHTKNVAQSVLQQNEHKKHLFMIKVTYNESRQF